MSASEFLTSTHQSCTCSPRSPSARKRLAVPYRAADTPSERSEYAQPDTALALTTLAYYGDGLSRVEMVEAVTGLLRMGPSAQRAFYDTWLRSGRDSIPEGGWFHPAPHILTTTMPLDSKRGGFRVFSCAFPAMPPLIPSRYPSLLHLDQRSCIHLTHDTCRRAAQAG